MQERQEINRRKALTRLGIGAAVAYTAPILLHLDGTAMAKVNPSPCNKGKGKGGGNCPSGPSQPSKPSKAS